MFFNITFNIDEAIQEEWIALMTSTVIKSISCNEKKLLQIMVNEELGGVSYSLLLGFSDMSALKEFESNGLDLVYSAINQSFAGRWVSFTTQLNLVSEK